MNTTAHPVASEDLMALLDGELSAPLAESITAHLVQCEECASIVAQLRGTSESLARWTVPAVSPQMEHTVSEAAAEAAFRRKESSRNTRSRSSGWYWKPIAVFACLTLAGVFVGTSTRYFRRDHGPSLPLPAYTAPASGADAARHMPTLASTDALQSMASLEARRSEMQSQMALSPRSDRAVMLALPPPAGAIAGAATAPAFASSVISAPMIARTVSLTIVVKDFAAARIALDQVLARHHGYFAQLDVQSQEEGSRNLTASLRIPAPDLSAALNEMRGIGRVLNESQSGEEVTQQHQDLVARLQTARETEARFRAILQQRTGNLADVLSVEESIARVRGDIERMEAEQKTLEHRVDFASIEIQVRDEYKARLGVPGDSVSTRLHNAFVAGFHHASETILGIVLFIEEYGPAILIWLVLFAIPVVAWRRYQRMRSKF